MFFCFFFAFLDVLASHALASHEPESSPSGKPTSHPTPPPTNHQTVFLRPLCNLCCHATTPGPLRPPKSHLPGLV